MSDDRMLVTPLFFSAFFRVYIDEFSVGFDGFLRKLIILIWAVVQALI